jgi:hypothetical protein
MTPKLTSQEQKVYAYILAHPGCTSHDITRDTFIQKPCARIVGLESKGVVVSRIGQRKYEGSRAFECYAIGKPLTRFVSQVEVRDGVAIETRVEEPV